MIKSFGINKPGIGIGQRRWASGPNGAPSGVIENVTPTIITLTYDKALDEGSTPATSAFTVLGKTVSNIAVSGVTVVLTVSSAFIYADYVNVSYVQPVSNPIKGTGGGKAVSFSNLVITNNVTVDSDAAAYFDRMVSQPNQGIKRVLNKFFVGIKADGCYAELDNYCLYFLHTQQASLLDIKADARNHTLQGAVTWNAYTGFTIINNTYIHSNFTPGTHGSKYTQDNAGIYFDVTKVATDFFDEGVTTNTTYNITIGYGPTMSLYNKINDNTNKYTVWYSGFNAIVRTSSTAGLSRTNSVEAAFLPTTSTGLPTKECTIGAYNNNGSIVNYCIGNVYRSYGFGSAMDATKRAAFNSRVTILYSEVNQIGIQGTISDVFAGDSLLTERFDNIFNNSLVLYNSDGFDKRITASKFEFNTTNQNIIISAHDTIITSFPKWAEVSILENDVFKEKITFSGDNYPRAVTLSAGNKKVSIVESVISSATRVDTDVVGTFLSSVLASNFSKVSEGAVAGKIVFMGDSIMEGCNSVTPEVQGIASLFRIENSKNVNNYAIGNITLKGMADTTALKNRVCANLVSMFANVTTTKKLFIGLGTNDHTYGTYTANQFETTYGALLDAIHSADANIWIYCMSPILRTISENADLDAIRTKISDCCAARDTYTTYIVGKTILIAGDIDDGVHPTTAGQKKLKDALYAIIYP